jgi:hypothetical protein
MAHSVKTSSVKSAVSGDIDSSSVRTERRLSKRLMSSAPFAVISRILRGIVL